MSPSSLLAWRRSSESRYTWRPPGKATAARRVAVEQRRLLPHDINFHKEFFVSLKTYSLIATKNRQNRAFFFLNLNLCCSLTKIIEHRKNLLTTIDFVTDELAQQTDHEHLFP
jgi:hypothetical protein